LNLIRAKRSLPARAGDAEKYESVADARVRADHLLRIGALAEHDRRGDWTDEGGPRIVTVTEGEL
jgi:hypothetical protein